ncbi:MAG: glycosyltransferase family 4 protein [Longimicrobiaceae bacterium]
MPLRPHPAPRPAAAPVAPSPAPIRILALLEHYLPAYKAGGPLRTVGHMVEQLGEPFSFRIVTCDRDWGDRTALPEVVPGRWSPVGNGEAIYLAPEQLGLSGLKKVIRETEHDVLYLNSLFSPRLSIRPLLLARAGAIPRRPIVLAPRGELHPGALGGGSWGHILPSSLARRLGSPRYLKKQAYIAAARAAGLFRGITWQASNETEAEEIRRHVGRRANVVVAPDLAARPPESLPPPVAPKRAGALRAVFLSRIDDKKNLDGAIALLEGIRGEVEFDVYGPVGDERYWARCRAALDRLPPNVTARVHGAVPHDRVAEVFRAHELFVFPTRGENFGHVVLEAMVAGCPVLVSDRTPWRGLTRYGAGWDLPLDDVEGMRAVVQRCVDMDEEEYRPWSVRAAHFGREASADERPLRWNRALFEQVVRAGGPPPRGG